MSKVKKQKKKTPLKKANIQTSLACKNLKLYYFKNEDYEEIEIKDNNNVETTYNIADK